MTPPDLTSAVSLICLAAAAVILMLAIGIRRRYGPAVFITLAGLAAAVLFLPAHAAKSPVQITPLVVFDGYGVVYIALFCAAGAATVLLSWGYFENFPDEREEYFLLLLLAVLGASVLAVSGHFASLFLGLEILSVSLYSMIGYPHRTEAQVEAAVKYLILAAVSSAFLLFGMALFYAGSGSMQVGRVTSLLGAGDDRWLLAGAAMIVVAVGFKLAVVPFHLWTPDVYQGAPAPVAGFVATVSKGAVVALLLRLFPPGDLPPSLAAAFGLLAAASMIAGNLLALLQNNVKRLLAYSSIAHMGYLLVAFVAGGSSAAEAVTFYLATYFVTSLGAFGIVTLLSDSEKEAEELEDYRGLFRQHPWLAGILAAMMLSLAGLPLTAGFPGKFYLVAAGVAGARWALVVILVVTSTIGLFYYLRVVAVLFARQTKAPRPGAEPPLAGRITVAVLAFLLVWLGVLPGAAIEAIRAMM
jgi:NADH-quinone oxidoreductase subunit N